MSLGSTYFSDSSRSRSLSRNVAVQSESRDSFILQFVGEQGFLTRSQFRRLATILTKVSSPDSLRAVASRYIRRLKGEGLLEEVIETFSKEPLFKLTKQGMKSLEAISGESFIQPDFKHSSFRHCIAGTDFRLGWIENFDFRYWRPESELEADSSLAKTPDAELGIFSEKKGRVAKFAVEIELTVKSSARYRKIFLEYQNSNYDGVWYVARNESIKDKVLEIGTVLCDRVFVILLEEFLQNPKEACLYRNDLSLPLGSKFGGLNEA